MTPEAIIERVTADGVRLALSPNGKIKASGNEGAIARWLPIILEHRPGIVEALQAAVVVPIQAGATIIWTRADGTSQAGVVDFVYVDDAARRWACVTLGESWAFVNLKVVNGGGA